MLAAVIEYSVTINRKSQKRLISVVKLCNRFHHLHPVYIVVIVKCCKAAQCLLPQYGKMEVYVLHNSAILAGHEDQTERMKTLSLVTHLLL